MMRSVAVGIFRPAAAALFPFADFLEKARRRHRCDSVLRLTTWGTAPAEYGRRGPRGLRGKQKISHAHPCLPL